MAEIASLNDRRFLKKISVLSQKAKRGESLTGSDCDLDIALAKVRAVWHIGTPETWKQLLDRIEAIYNVSVK